MLDHAKPLATYDHPFFGRWPAITDNQYGKGTLIYEGTALSDALQQAVVQRALTDSAIAFDPQAFQSTVRVKRGSNAQGKSLTYLLNYSSTTAEVKYTGPAAHDALTGKSRVRRPDPLHSTMGLGYRRSRSNQRAGKALPICRQSQKARDLGEQEPDRLSRYKSLKPPQRRTLRPTSANPDARASSKESNCHGPKAHAALRQGDDGA